MSDRALVDLDALAALPADDARIGALAPHERAQLAAYREFLREPSDVPATQLADADARLGEALDDAMGLGAPAPSPRIATRGAGSTIAERLASWFAPARGPAWAVAALLMLSAGLWSVSRGPVPVREQPVMRGAESDEIAVEHDVVGEGQLELDWRSRGIGVTYEVRWFDASGLEEIGRTELAARTKLRLRHNRLPEGLSSGQQVVYQVVALRDGDLIARSLSTSIRVP